MWFRSMPQATREMKCQVSSPVSSWRAKAFIRGGLDVEVAFNVSVTSSTREANVFQEPFNTAAVMEAREQSKLSALSSIYGVQNRFPPIQSSVGRENVFDMGLMGDLQSHAEWRCFSRVRESKNRR